MKVEILMDDPSSIELPPPLVNAIERLLASCDERHHEAIINTVASAYVLGVAQGIRRSVDRLRILELPDHESDM